MKKSNIILLVIFFIISTIPSFSQGNENPILKFAKKNIRLGCSLANFQKQFPSSKYFETIGLTTIYQVTPDNYNLKLYFLNDLELIAIEASCFSDECYFGESSYTIISDQLKKKMSILIKGEKHEGTTLTYYYQQRYLGIDELYVGEESGDPAFTFKLIDLNHLEQLPSWIESSVLFEMSNLIYSKGDKEDYVTISTLVLHQAEKQLEKTPKDVQSYYNPYRIIIDVNEKTGNNVELLKIYNKLELIYPSDEYVKKNIEKYQTLVGENSLLNENNNEKSYLNSELRDIDQEPVKINYLETGNEWNYEIENIFADNSKQQFNMINKITRETLIDNKLYKELNVSYEGILADEAKYYYRVAADGIFCRDEQDKENEYLDVKLPLALHVKWKSKNNFQNITQEVSKIQSYNFNGIEYKNCFKISFEGEQSGRKMTGYLIANFEIGTIYTEIDYEGVKQIARLIKFQNKLDKRPIYNLAETNFAEFLRKFKIDLMQENKAKIIEMTNFPFWYYYMDPHWKDTEEFLRAYDLIFYTEAIQSILYAQLDQEIETKFLDGIVKVTKETNEEILAIMKNKFNIDSNEYYTLYYSYTSNPARGIVVNNFYYFVLTKDGFKLIGSGLL